MGDGGIYILHTPGETEGMMEYRVMHLYDVKEIWGKLPNGRIDYDLISGENLQKLFGKTKVYKEIEDAQQCASKLYYRLEISDPALIKDGINAVHLAEPFSFYIATSGTHKPKIKQGRNPRKPAAKRTKKNESKSKKTKGN
jgi:hypothetical protein